MTVGEKNGLDTISQAQFMKSSGALWRFSFGPAELIL
jgi:hypothetical protein